MSVIIGAATVIMLAFGWVIVVVNPFEWGAETSASFTWRKFDEVKRGESIARVIEMLGQPIKPAASYESVTGNDALSLALIGWVMSARFR